MNPISYSTYRFPTQYQTTTKSSPSIEKIQFGRETSTLIGKTTIKEHGRTVTADIRYSLEPKGIEKFSLYREGTTECLGYITLADKPNFQYPPNQKKGALLIKYVEKSKKHPKAEHVGTQLILLAIQRSVEKGHQGRIILISAPDAIPFYFKLGFRCENGELKSDSRHTTSGETLNQELEKQLTRGGTIHIAQHVLPLMFLPGDAIARCLKKIRQTITYL